MACAWVVLEAFELGARHCVQTPEVRECMFNHLVLRQPPIMQTSAGLKVAVHGACEPELQIRPVQSPLVQPSMVCGVVIQAAGAPSVLAEKTVLAEETLMRCSARSARQHKRNSTMAPRRRWETNTAGDVR